MHRNRLALFVGADANGVHLAVFGQQLQFKFVGEVGGRKRHVHGGGNREAAVHGRESTHINRVPADPQCINLVLNNLSRIGEESVDLHVNPFVLWLSATLKGIRLEQ